MSQEAPDVIVDEYSQQAENMSNDEMDSFFKQAQAEEQSFLDENQPNEQEASYEEGTETLRDESSANESTESEQLERDVAKLSSEDGREEHSDKQVQDDESAERSEERREVLSQEERSYKAAMREERELRRQIQQELAESREAAKKMSEAFSKLIEGADSPKAPSIPSFEDDPIGHMRAKLEMADQRIEKLTQTEQQIQQSQHQQQEMQKFMSQYQSKAAEFAQDQPDFNNAYQHLLGELQKDYMAQGLSLAEANAEVNRAELQLAEAQMKRNLNPARTIYEMAKRRGYVPASQKSEQSKSNNPIEKIERMERGVKASRSINGKGVSPNTRMTLEEIADLDDDAFDKVDWNKVLQMG